MIIYKILGFILYFLGRAIAMCISIAYKVAIIYAIYYGCAGCLPHEPKFLILAGVLIELFFL